MRSFFKLIFVNRITLVVLSIFFGHALGGPSYSQDVIPQNTEKADNNKYIFMSISGESKIVNLGLAKEIISSSELLHDKSIAIKIKLSDEARKKLNERPRKDSTELIFLLGQTEFSRAIYVGEFVDKEAYLTIKQPSILDDLVPLKKSTIR